MNARRVECAQSPSVPVSIWAQNLGSGSYEALLLCEVGSVLFSDERALVLAAKQFGYNFTTRTPESVTVDIVSQRLMAQTPAGVDPGIWFEGAGPHSVSDFNAKE